MGMRVRKGECMVLPLVCAVVVMVETVGLGVYAAMATSGIPNTLYSLPGVCCGMAVLFGVRAAWLSPQASWARLVYTVSMVVVFVGYASFYLFLNPTTINLAGLLAVVCGLPCALISGSIMLIKTRTRRRRSEAK